MNYSIQLYSVRDTMPTDLEGTLRRLAEMGYKSVEFCDFFGKTAEEICKLKDELGIGISGTHVHLANVAADFDKLTAYHKAVGNKYIIEPMADLSTREKLDAFVKLANELTPRLEKKGFTVCYHNHWHEFVPNKDGIIPCDVLLTETTLKMELDTFWAFAAGRDPLELMDTLGGRLALIHIKDGFPPSGDGEAKGMPLGKGSAPVREVYKKALKLNVPMVVESETLTPDGLTEARVCIEFLRSIE